MPALRPLDSLLPLVWACGVDLAPNDTPLNRIGPQSMHRCSAIISKDALESLSTYLEILLRVLIRNALETLQRDPARMGGPDGATLTLGDFETAAQALSLQWPQLPMRRPGLVTLEANSQVLGGGLMIAASDQGVVDLTADVSSPAGVLGDPNQSGGLFFATDPDAGTLDLRWEVVEGVQVNYGSDGAPLPGVVTSAIVTQVPQVEDGKTVAHSEWHEELASKHESANAAVRVQFAFREVWNRKPEGEDHKVKPTTDIQLQYRLQEASSLLRSCSSLAMDHAEDLFIAFLTDLERYHGILDGTIPIAKNNRRMVSDNAFAAVKCLLEGVDCFLTNEHLDKQLGKTGAIPILQYVLLHPYTGGLSAHKLIRQGHSLRQSAARILGKVLGTVRRDNSDAGSIDPPFNSPFQQTLSIRVAERLGSHLRSSSPQLTSKCGAVLGLSVLPPDVALPLLLPLASRMNILSQEQLSDSVDTTNIAALRLRRKSQALLRESYTAAILENVSKANETTLTLLWTQIEKTMDIFGAELAPEPRDIQMV